MPQTEPLPITPEMLLWARESAGMTVEDVAGKIRKESDEISSWEDPKNTNFPSYAQLNKLSNIYKRPIVFFFFLSPPKELDPDITLRTRTLSNDIIKLDKNIRFLFREACVNIKNIYELHDQEKANNKFLDLFSYSIDDNAKNLARQARSFLKVTVKEQMQFKSQEEALKFWREIVEKQNIFVFKKKFNDRKSPKNENPSKSPFCGFCLHDEKFPVIYLNNRNSSNRQIFTLFHEMAHLIYRVSGVDAHNSYALTDRTDTKDSKIERLCNVFAAEFLVPEESFCIKIKDFKNIIFDDPRVRKLSETYKVSKNVILVKLCEQGIVTRLFYEEQNKKWQNDYENHYLGKKSGGGNYYRTEIEKTSKKYAKLVFSNYYQGHISDYQLSDYLNISLPSIGGFEQKLW